LTAGLVLQLLALWPVILWSIRRVSDGSDEPWGICALVTALGVVLTKCRRLHSSAALLPVAAVALYGASLPWLSPLPRALLGLLALSLSISRYCFGVRLHLGVLGLCWLSIPLLASLDFYLGYPLRLCTAELAQLMLNLSGTGVVRRGVSLVIGEREVSVDPACSGIRMLWGSAYVTAVLASLSPLNVRRSILACTMALVWLLLGNAWRSAALFYAESGRINLPSWGHEALGTIVLVLTLGAIGGTWYAFTRDQATPIASARRDSIAAPQPAGSWPLATVASMALAASAFPATRQPKPNLEGFHAWVTEFEGNALVADGEPAEAANVYQDFPGKVAFFRTKTQRLVLRWIGQSTRKLHPAEHCYRANGYRVDHARQCVRAGGVRFGCFLAAKGNRRVQVSERIYDDRGGNWTDVSSWYWAALVGQTKGPWHSVTLAEACDQ
jgi:exosortase/archaeosortase family protein